MSSISVRVPLVLPTLLAMLLLAGIAPRPAMADRVEVQPVTDPSWCESLDGPWRFKYEGGPVSETARVFWSTDFTDENWSTLAVPAHWELHGFAEPKYAKVDDGNGYYRRRFTVPATWDDRRVLLRFEGVLYGLEVWVNGRPVGEWASSYNPVTFDVTDAVKRGGENVVAVRVSTHPKGWEFDTNDCWALSGIYREVTLMAVPQTYVRHFTAQTHLLADGAARVDLTVETAGEAKDGAVRGRLVGPEGSAVTGFSIELHDGKGTAAVEVLNPRLWSAETPALHSLELQLVENGSVIQEVRQRIGLREVSIKDGVLLLNGRPIKLRGVDHHDIWPVEGRVATEERLRQDLDLIRAANCNFIRTSHYPPHPRLIELCDELGIYVMDEVPFGFGDSHLTDPTYQDILHTRARATVLRDENHPSVIIWSVGNENPNTPLTFATAQRVKELDPTRPVCFPQVGSYFARTYPELPEWVDIYAPHYPQLETVKAYAAKLKRPVIFTEYAHALGLTGEEVQAEWPVMRSSQHLAGGAVWMFQDQGIVRNANSPMSPESARLAVYPDRSHVYDTEGNQGMDGLVYSDRVPQPDYWEVRKVYSPVQIPLRRVPVAAGTQTLRIPVENWFDFRSLAGVTVQWELRRNAGTVASGTVALRAKPREGETIQVPVSIPADAADDLLSLVLTCRDGGAAPFYERTVRLDLEKSAGVAQALLRALSPGTVTVEQDERVLRITHPLGRILVDRSTGVMTFLNRSDRAVATGPYVHAGRRFTEGERNRQKRELPWPGSRIEVGENVAIDVTRTDAGGARVAVKGRYARPDDAKQAIEGGYVVEVQRTGAVELSYDYQFVAAKGLVLEAGLTLMAPADATELRWIGDGPYQAYPDKDALDEFGVFQLNREDLNFQGNRRAVDLALLAAPDGSAVGLLGNGMDVAVERSGIETLLSHNALLSGRGQKGGSAETRVLAESHPALRGRFVLLTLTPDWPKRLRAWLGEPARTVPAFKPYWRSYDQ